MRDVIEICYKEDIIPRIWQRHRKTGTGGDDWENQIGTGEYKKIQGPDSENSSCEISFIENFAFLWYSFNPSQVSRNDDKIKNTSMPQKRCWYK